MMLCSSLSLDLIMLILELQFSWFWWRTWRNWFLPVVSHCYQWFCLEWVASCCNSLAYVKSYQDKIFSNFTQIIKLFLKWKCSILLISYFSKRILKLKSKNISSKIFHLQPSHKVAKLVKSGPSDILYIMSLPSY